MTAAPAASELPTIDRLAAELVDQGSDVACRLEVAVGREGGVAVAVTAQVGGGDGVAGGDEWGSQEAVRGAKIAHPGTRTTSGPVPWTS